MNTDIGLLNPSDINVVWRDVVELIEDRGEDLLEVYSIKELFLLVLSEKLDLWMVTEGDELKLIGFCGWERHAARNFYHVIWVGGSGLGLMKEAVPVVEQYVCMNEGSELVFSGRAGWDRVLRPLGFVMKPKWSKDVTICWKH